MRLSGEGLVRSTTELLNWNERVFSGFYFSDLAFQGGSLYLSGSSLTAADVDVLGKDLLP